LKINSPGAIEADNKVTIKGTKVNDTEQITNEIDLEKTPEFEAWKKAKIQEIIAYHKYAWKVNTPFEDLLMYEDALGFPDNVLQQKAHKFVAVNLKYDPINGEARINPATGRSMVYKIWQVLPTALNPVTESPSIAVEQ
jgi:hypothetical protein